MKKIVIATDFWRPEINGVTRMIENNVRFLKGKGFEMTVIHPRLFRHVPLFFYPDMKVALFVKKRMAAILDREIPDYIHIATEGPVGLAARSYCLERGIPFTTFYQGNIPQYVEHYTQIKSSFMFDAVYKYFTWFHHKSSQVLVATKTLQEELDARGFERMSLCPLGVDTKLFNRNLRAAKSVDAYKHPVFVYFGRVAKEKNIEEFLQLTLPGTKLVIGDGPIRATLEKKYPEVQFVGWKKGKDLVNLLSLSDVFVFPSLTETFGLVVIEALACQVPVAAHDVMGPRDIISDGVDGCLDQDLRQAALACLNIDRAQCRKKALEFSMEKAAEQFMNIILQYPAKVAQPVS